MDLSDIRNLHSRFYQKRGHYYLPSFSVVPRDPKGPMFTTAGMHPLVPFLKGEENSEYGTRLASCQKVVRTTDLDEIGDVTHLTFFEMLGNWSLGDYGKAETLRWSYEFLNLLEGLQLQHFWVTVFAGDDEASRDDEAASIWKSLGVPEQRIVFLGKKDNWWAMGPEGLCGPCSEMFIDTQPHLPVTASSCLGNDPTNRFVEIGNNVFMNYVRDGSGLRKLPRPNIDVGYGLERMAVMTQGVGSVYDLKEFRVGLNILQRYVDFEIESTSKAWRVILDHVRALLGILSDPVPTVPRNTGRGYIVRQLVRRVVTQCTSLGVPEESVETLLRFYAHQYEDVYPEMMANIEHVVRTVSTEYVAFQGVLSKAEDNLLRLEIPAGSNLTAEQVFDLKTTHGIPPEVTVQLAEKLGYTASLAGIALLEEKHRMDSRG